MTITAVAAASDDHDNTAVPRQRRVENPEFAAFNRRILRAFSRRVSNGDIEALPQLIDLAGDLNDAINGAVEGLREFGYGWPEIASRIGISRQAARQRWGAKEKQLNLAPGDDAEGLFPLDFFRQADDDYA